MEQAISGECFRRPVHLLKGRFGETVSLTKHELVDLLSGARPLNLLLQAQIRDGNPRGPLSLRQVDFRAISFIFSSLYTLDIERWLSCIKKTLGNGYSKKIQNVCVLVLYQVI